MKNSKEDRTLLGISLAGFLGMSVSFTLMPLEILGRFPGILFWGGLITGVVLQMILEKRRKVFFSASNLTREKIPKTKNGLLTFGSNREAKVADNALLCSVAATIITVVATKGSGNVCYVLIAVTTYCFCLHCILNGRIYFYIKNQEMVRQAPKQKKASNKNKGEG